MRLNQLIQELTRLQQDHGDIEVMIYSDTMSFDIDSTDVETGETNMVAMVVAGEPI